MLRYLWFHEWLRLRREPMHLVAWLGLIGLLLTAAWLNAAKINAWTQAGETARQKELALWQHQSDELSALEAGTAQEGALFGSPRSYFSWAGAVTVFPFDPWSVLSTGSSDLFAPVSQVQFFKKARVPGQDLANPLPRLFGSFDPAFVLLYLLPLFVIALNYGLLADERETGILALVLAQPVSPRRLLFLRVCFRWVTAVTAAVGALVAALAMAGANLAARPAALFAPALLIGLYTAFWLLLCWWVNTVARNPRQCAVALVGIWALLLLVVPATAQWFGAVVHPPPSQIEAITALRRAAAEAGERDREILAQFYQDHPELVADRSDAYQQHQATFAWYQRMLAVFEAVQAASAPLEAAHAEQVARRMAFERRLALVSPAVIVGEAFDQLAGTSRAHFARYQAAVDDFADQFRGFFVAKAFREEVMLSSDLARLPRFHMAPVRIDAAVWRAIVWLLLVNGGLFLWLWRRSRDLPVR